MIDGVHELIRTRRKTVGIEVRPDATVRVRAPERMPLRTIQDIVSKNRSWIDKQLKQASERPPEHRPRQFLEGEPFLYLGNRFPLCFQELPGNTVFQFDSNEFTIVPRARDHAKSLFEQWYRLQAKPYILQRVNWYSVNYDIRYRKARITSATTRWGSCSGKGNLNFSWRLIMTPMRVIDYVVVHELAHLNEMNHSNRFWSEVERMLPDYQEAKLWLKQHQREVDAFG